MSKTHAIVPGSKINLKVVKTPQSAATAKTLVRLLSKDPAIKRENRRLAEARAKGFRTHQRGGRQWGVRLIKQRPVQGRVGESGTITATLDVLRDLAGVQRFVEVSAG